MVYKLAHGAEIDSLPLQMSGKLYDNLLEFLLVLDNEYGTDRDVKQDDGGYVLFCTPGTTDSEIQRYFDFNGLVSDWVADISHQPKYCASLYFLRTAS
ncbi:hypothetical protein AALA83_13870 [Oscillospiraceae bacterium 44-5]